jgi:hypothetical protein
MCLPLKNQIGLKGSPLRDCFFFVFAICTVFLKASWSPDIQHQVATSTLGTLKNLHSFKKRFFNSTLLPDPHSIADGLAKVP